MQIQKDKVLHFAAGAVIGSGVFIITRSAAWGIGAAAVAGIAKEVGDSFGHGDTDAFDALATLAGGMVACGVLSLFC